MPPINYLMNQSSHNESNKIFKLKNISYMQKVFGVDIKYAKTSLLCLLPRFRP